MLNELVTEWCGLKTDCQSARLPSPKMQPGGLSGTTEVSIPGHIKRMSKDVGSAIADTRLWIRGYLDGRASMMATEEPTYSDCPVKEAALLAERVLQISGEGGPDDHELLAKAILQLTYALEKK